MVVLHVIEFLYASIVWGVIFFLVLNLILSFLFNYFPNLISTPQERLRADYISRFEGDLKPHVEDWFGLAKGEWEEFSREYKKHELNIYSYEPFCEYKHPARSGRFINISDHGFRHGSDQKAWPPQNTNFNIFFFGGSTTLSVGPDRTCIPSYLQEILNENRPAKDIATYNFGRGAYFSTLEKNLFLKLLSEGFKPDLCIFLDGINDSFFYHGLPATHGVYTAAIDAMNLEISSQSRNLFRATPKWNHLKLFLISLPLFRAISILIKRKQGVGTQQLAKYTKDEISQVYGRWSENKVQIEAVARVLSIPVIFVWQPSPAYSYDLECHIALPRHFSLHGHERAREVYQYVNERLSNSDKESFVLWLGDIQEHSREPLYIDTVHYTAKFSKQIANLIAQYIKERGLIRV